MSDFIDLRIKVVNLLPFGSINDWAKLRIMEQLIDGVVAAAQALTWVEIVAVLTGIVYVVLAAQENIWCWIWGIISSVLSIHLFWTAQLYAESMLYIYYVIAGIYGWYAWSRQSAKTATVSVEQPVLKIQIWPWKRHLLLMVLGVGLSFLLAFTLQSFTNARLPLLDSFTTIFSFIATFLVTRKVLENWIYWIIIDLVTSGMYFSREINLYALLMIVYAIIAVIGFRKWQKKGVLEKGLS